MKQVFAWAVTIILMPFIFVYSVFKYLTLPKCTNCKKKHLYTDLVYGLCTKCVTEYNEHISKDKIVYGYEIRDGEASDDQIVLNIFPQGVESFYEDDDDLPRFKFAFDADGQQYVFQRDENNEEYAVPIGHDGWAL